MKMIVDSENKSSFKFYPLAILPLIYPIFHFHYFRAGESRLNNLFFYNDYNVIQKAE